MSSENATRESSGRRRAESGGLHDPEPLRCSAVIVAAGSGSRFGGTRPKQLALLAGRPVLSHTLAAFESLPEIEEIALVLPETWRAVIEAEAVRPFGFKKVKCLVGGAERTDSARRGFEATTGEIVLIHDGVRPLVRPELILAVARAAREHGAALAAVPVSDTLKEVAEPVVQPYASGGVRPLWGGVGEPGGRNPAEPVVQPWASDGANPLLGVRRTVDRTGLWQAQTPQGFRREVLKRALEAADEEARAGRSLRGPATDDIALVEKIGLAAAVVSGSRRNLKITAPEDLEMAEALLARDRRPRIGHGYDLHRLVPGRPLFLGCVEIPFEKGLLGHSDADVLAHALADALLGAAALGDIGEHFPAGDPAWAGVSGSSLLAETMRRVRAAGFELLNADLCLVGERPKLGPHRAAMIEATARALGAPPEAVSLKATTTEGLEATGRGEALAAHAVVLII